MQGRVVYRPEYDVSRALVLGINEYQLAGPLEYARQDAEAIAAVLRDTYGFLPDNVTLLVDAEATRDRIIESFLSFAMDRVGADDRIVVFFAGHGCTKSSSRGEVGYLVPVDGDVDRLESLIRWDELTRNSDLIPAKHILFLMDACYGGLAVMRTPPAGSSRFMHDMIQRYSRQVLTAGKADEPVADSGGPRPDHSVFSGHLLNALEGDAATTDGLVTANSVMAYVYDRVSRDQYSRQTPHFGFIDGDGDLIFNVPAPEEGVDPGEGPDILIQLPATPGFGEGPAEEVSLADTVKDYLSDSKFRIRLDDLVSDELRSAVYELGLERFATREPKPNPEEFAARLKAYEDALARISVVANLVSRWGASGQASIVARIVTTLSDTAAGLADGYQVWADLRWYPLMRLMYTGGIAALSSDNYESLYALLNARVVDERGRAARPAVVPTSAHILDIDRVDMFKHLPGHERHFTPRSEYMFGSAQPEIEDLFFVGSRYEDLFDRFEVLYALVQADLMEEEYGTIWGSPGRFGWKHRRGGSPFDGIVEEAAAQRDDWAPIRAGFFEGTFGRFEHIAAGYREEVLGHLGWY